MFGAHLLSHCRGKPSGQDPALADVAPQQASALVTKRSSKSALLLRSRRFQLAFAHRIVIVTCSENVSHATDKEHGNPCAAITDRTRTNLERRPRPSRRDHHPPAQGTKVRNAFGLSGMAWSWRGGGGRTCDAGDGEVARRWRGDGEELVAVVPMDRKASRSGSLPYFTCTHWEPTDDSVPAGTHLINKDKHPPP